MIEFNDKQILILQIAEKLFAENGFDGTLIRDIAKDANVNIAMISYYFGSKEKLLERLIFFRSQDLRIKLKNLFEEAIDPIQKIEKFIEYYIEKIDSNRNMYQILHFEITNKRRAMDLEAFTEVKKGNLQILEKIINEGQQQKCFKTNIQVPLITPTILGTYFNFVTNKPFFENILGLDSEDKFNTYIKNELTNHIKQTIKSLLIYEN